MGGPQDMVLSARAAARSPGALSAQEVRAMKTGPGAHALARALSMRTGLPVALVRAGGAVVSSVVEVAPGRWLGAGGSYDLEALGREVARSRPMELEAISISELVERFGKHKRWGTRAGQGEVGTAASSLLGEAGRGWVQGQAHPSGGYTSHKVMRPFGGGSCTQHFVNAEDRLHRQDGPALVRSNGEQVWMEEGSPHRAGGPCEVDRWGSAGAYAVQGTTLAVANESFMQELNAHRKDRLGPVVTIEVAEQRIALALAAGAQPASASYWAAFENEDITALVGAEVEASRAFELKRAGLDAATTIEVAAGRLPISWALAGQD